jgi:hypothetical protein
MFNILHFEEVKGYLTGKKLSQEAPRKTGNRAAKT